MYLVNGNKKIGYPGIFPGHDNSLTYILTLAKLDATGQRWVASLTNYHFRIFYRSGKTNVEADALSQIPRHTQMMDIPTVKAIIKVIPFPIGQIINESH